MKIILTGATGFIGTKLFSRLAQAGHDVIGVSLPDRRPRKRIYALDLCDSKRVRAFFRTRRADCIIHLAAYVPRDSEEAEHHAVFHQNLLSTLNLLEEFSTGRFKKFIFASSVSVLGLPRGISNEASKPNPRTLYALSKLFCEMLVARYGEQTGKHVIALRLSAPYGPGQTRPTVVSRFVERARSNKPLVVQGSGKRSQDFIYVDDAVDAFVKAATSTRSGVYNIGSGVSVSTLQLAKTVLRNFPDSRSRIVFSGKDPEEKYRLRLSITKAKKKLRFTPHYSLNEGLQAYSAHLNRNETRHHL